jgi:tetratricopeptide (TPR) repeat protein
MSTKIWKVISVMIFLSGICPGVARGQILFSDTFTGRDGTRPSGWTITDAPEKGFWYLKDGQFSTGNGDDLLTPSGFSYAIVSAPGCEAWRDYSVQCSVWIFQNNGRILLLARWQDKDNHYEGTLETYQGKRSLYIDKLSKGRRTTLARVRDGEGSIVIPKIEGGASSADARLMNFTVAGSRLILSFAGQKYLEADDQTFPSGTAGLGEWYHFAYFDDFIVQQAAAATISATPVAPGQVVTGTPVVGGPAPQVGTPSGVVTSALPGTIYRVLLGKGMDEANARNLRSQLLGWGYSPVEVSQSGVGFDVFVGSFYSEAEAQKAKKFLEDERLNPQEVVSVSGEKAAEVKKQSEKGKVIYRVQANEFPDMAAAVKVKTNLESDGYTMVEIAGAAGKQKVYIGSFNSKDEAESLAKVMRDDGYIESRTVELSAPEVSPDMVPVTGPGTTAEPTQPVIPKNIMERNEWKALSPEQQQEIINAIIAENALRRGDVYAQEILQLKKRLLELGQNQKTIITSIRDQAEEANKRKIEVAELFSKANKARDLGQWQEALGYLDEVTKIDPGNARIDIMKKTIDNLSKNIKFEGQPIIEQEKAEQIKRARDSAEQTEKDNNIQVSLAQWNIVKSLAKPDSLDYVNANTAIGRLESVIKQAEDARRRQEKRWQIMIYGIAALIIVLLIAIIIFGMRSRKHDQELLRQVQELTLKPLLELKEGRAPGAIEDKTTGAPPAAVKHMVTEQLEPAPEVAASGQTDIFWTEAVPARPAGKVKMDEVFPASPPPVYEEVPELFPEEVGEKGEAFAVPEEPRPSVKEMREEVKTPQEGIPEEPVYPSSGMQDISSLSNIVVDTKSQQKEGTIVRGRGIDIDDLLSIKSPADEAPPLPDEVEVKPAGEVPVDELLFGESEETRKGEESFTKPVKESAPVARVPKPMPDITPALDIFPETPVSPEPAKMKVKDIVGERETPAIQPSVSVPPKAETTSAPKQPSLVAEGTRRDMNIVFEQNFDEEETGKKPVNWRGDYNYASLCVSDATPAKDSKKCLVFDKEKGAGSAFYCCHFPDTEGVMGVEFDFRCDNKNKYLLGFYVEKDEDYRYSVHTVVQYIDSGKQKSQPSLRVQGKSVNYTWGEWCHLKYIVNLFDGTVDGYVNGALVANGEKLASCPSCLNTISIRDNLATVGKLMVDNIKIYKI